MKGRRSAEEANTARPAPLGAVVYRSGVSPARAKHAAAAPDFNGNAPNSLFAARYARQVESPATGKDGGKGAKPLEAGNEATQAG